MFSTVLFYLFCLGVLLSALSVVTRKNPIASAVSLVCCFFFLSGLYAQLDAHFVAVTQVLVYAGAIMVLFLFIIMLLDLKAEAKWSYKPVILVGGILIPLLFIVQLCGILSQVPNVEPEPLDLEKAAKSFYDEERKEDEQSEIHKSLADGSLPDVNLIGLTMFGHQGDNETIATPGYNFPLQVVGVLLLVATVGVVALSMKKKPTREEPAERSEP